VDQSGGVGHVYPKPTTRRTRFPTDGVVRVLGAFVVNRQCHQMGQVPAILVEHFGQSQFRWMQDCAQPLGIGVDLLVPIVYTQQQVVG